MDLVLRFGGALLGGVLLLFAVLLVITRLYIHTFKKRIQTTQEELVAVRSELTDLKKTLDRQPQVYEPPRYQTPQYHTPNELEGIGAQ